jgi:hypothetical protein
MTFEIDRKSNLEIAYLRWAGKESDTTDALAALLGAASTLPEQSSEPFELQLLRALRGFEQGIIHPTCSTDPWLFGLIDALFIRPNQTSVADVHEQANHLAEVQATVRFTADQVTNWRRFMEDLRLGYAIGELGFTCAYHADLVAMIFQQWHQHKGTLKDFFANCFTQYLPYMTNSGQLARSLGVALDELHEDRIIAFDPSPSPGLVGWPDPFSLIVHVRAP